MRPGIERKKKIVDELVTLIRSGKTIAVANVEGVPASLLQRIRKELHGIARIRVAKKRLLARALEQAGISELGNYLEGTTAIIVSDEDPFKLFRTVKELKDYAPVRPGRPAPVDVVVPAGPTGLPAPMIAEIKAAGLPARVNKGVIEIEKEFVAVRAGEVVSEALANALAKIGVKPVELKVRILAAWSEGILFPADVLDVDEQKVLEDVKRAYVHALNLAVNAGYPTKASLPILIRKAYMHALNLAVNAGYLTRETARFILAKAYGQALALASRLPPDALDEDLRRMLNAAAVATQGTPPEGAEEKKEEKKEEEEAKKEEEAAAGLASLFG